MDHGNIQLQEPPQRTGVLKSIASALNVAPEAPSILEQTKWPTGFYSFPTESEDTEYFNCGIIEHNGSDWLIARRAKRGYLRSWKNSLVAWRLENNQPMREREIQIQPLYAKEEWEDPRAYVFGGRLHVSYCNFIQGRTFAHQCLTRLDNGFRASRPIRPVYGKNGSAIMRNAGHEKNWIWFEHNNQLHFVYRTQPHEVCRWDGMTVAETYTTEDDHKWKWGEARGGTPPVRVGDEYFSFFHSSMPWRGRIRKYYMGCYAFEAKPPFKITRMSRKPILIGSPDDPRKPFHSVVTFPCGSLYRNDTWRVVMGINDQRCGFIDIPHKELCRLLK